MPIISGTHIAKKEKATFKIYCSDMVQLMGKRGEERGIALALALALAPALVCVPVENVSFSKGFFCVRITRLQH